MKTLEEALQYISQLESENKALREEVERYRSMGRAGRKKHDALYGKWKSAEKNLQNRAFHGLQSGFQEAPRRFLPHKAASAADGQPHGRCGHPAAPI